MKKSEVLQVLREAQGEYLSGEALCRTFGVSRTAIWKAIGVLREEGYKIESATNKGYCLCEVPDIFNQEEIERALSSAKGELIYFPTIDSTNTHAKRMALDAFSDPTYLVSGEQTAGRGRLGRSFSSPPGKGIYLSILKKPELKAGSLIKVTACTGVAICNAIEKVTGIRPQIKWTNDLVLGEKKLGGILTEISTEGESGRVQSLIVGVGLNILQTEEDFDPSLRQIATSLYLHSGEAFSRAELAAAEIEELDKMFEAILRGEEKSYMEQYRKDLITLGREVTVIRGNEKREATAFDLDEDAALIVRYHDTGTIEKVQSGEVSVRGIFGYV